MIGYVDSLVNYVTGGRPKKAQSIPASLFYRDEGIGLYKLPSEVTQKSASFKLAKRNLIKNVPFNLFISEKHKLSFTVGEHPIQDGSTVSDHVSQQLQEVTIEGLLTNHPVKKLEDTKEIKFKDDYATSNVHSTVSNTAIDGLENIRKIAKAKRPVRLVCSLDVYPKMVITDLSYDRDEKSGSSIRFSMTLREVNIVDLTAITGEYDFSPRDMDNANSRINARKKNLGKRNAEEVSADEYKKLLDAEVSQ